MARKLKRVYSQYSKEAVKLLGQLISVERKEQNISTKELSERAGISRSTLAKIEKGDMHCEIGITFEVATLLSISLFSKELNEVRRLSESIEDKLTLLPKAVRHRGVDDDF